MFWRRTMAQTKAAAKSRSKKGSIAFDFHILPVRSYNSSAYLLYDLICPKGAGRDTTGMVHHDPLERDPDSEPPALCGNFRRARTIVPHVLAAALRFSSP